MVVSHEVDDRGLAELRRPRDDLVSEVVVGRDRFTLDHGPFRSWERTLQVDGGRDGTHRVVETIAYRTAVAVWRPLFALPLRWAVRARRVPWWAPPDRLDARATRVLCLLACVQVVDGYLGTVITQTITFASDEFGRGDTAQGVTLAVVRLGIVVALGVVAVADRRGRRRLLVATALAAVTAPTIVPSSVLCRAEGAPSNRITVGLTGSGSRGTGVMGSFLREADVQVIATCDPYETPDGGGRNRKLGRQPAAETVGKKYGTKPCDTYDDFRKLCARKDLDAVIVATPDHWHALACLESLRNKKDVYCEKPLTHNVHESIEVMNAVKKNKAVLQTGSMQRSSREFRVACELVRNGIIGKVERTAVNIGNAGIPCDLATEKMEPGLDWEKWIGPGPMRGYSSVLSPRGVHGHFPNWRNYKEYGGGMVCDWGAHMIDIVHWGLGMDDSGPVATIPAENPKALKGAQ